MGVLVNDFRHPVVLAKEAATLDVVSGGRLDLGLGAGWLQEESTPPGSRSARAELSSGSGRRYDIVPALLRGEHVDHTGRWYTIAGVTGLPRGVQRPAAPHPPRRRRPEDAGPGRTRGRHRQRRDRE